MSRTALQVETDRELREFTREELVDTLITLQQGFNDAVAELERLRGLTYGDAIDYQLAANHRDMMRRLCVQRRVGIDDDTDHIAQAKFLFGMQVCCDATGLDYDAMLDRLRLFAEHEGLRW